MDIVSNFGDVLTIGVGKTFAMNMCAMWWCRFFQFANVICENIL